jgi:hypothetical protein
METMPKQPHVEPWDRILAPVSVRDQDGNVTGADLSTTVRRAKCTGVALVLVALTAGCSGRSDSGALTTEDVVKRAVVVPPTTPGWNWPKVRTSSTPYSEDKGGDPPSTPNELAVKLNRQLRGLDLIGGAGSRWDDTSKLSNLVVEQWSSAADAHSAMPAYREFARGWAEKTGAVSDEAVGGLGDEAWRILARGYSEEVTYKWRRGNLVLEAHIQCLSACRSDIDEAARAWVDAIDHEVSQELGGS